MKFLLLSSFKSRYLVLSASLVLVIIITISISEDKIKTTSNELTTNISERIEVSKIFDALNLNISKANRAIDFYMISPNLESRKTLKKSFSNIKSNLNKLKNHQWIKVNLLPHTIIDFDKIIYDLNIETLQLMKIRTNANKMYPFTVVANISMLGTNQSIIALLNNAITEKLIDDNLGTPQHLLLINLRDQWRLLINNFRIYLINRLGSLFEGTLPYQANNVEESYTIIQRDLEKLVALRLQDETGVDTEILIDEIPALIKQWYTDYNKILKINNGPNWRTDIPVLTNRIHPMFKQLNSDFEYISRKLHSASTLDLDMQKKSMDTISYYLWTLTVFVIGFIVTSTFFLYRNLLQPIEKLSSNLKLEAQGKTTEAIHNINTSEIKNFTNAFSEMQYQVHSRQMALEHMAMHDALTSLPNRALLIDRLNHAILSAKRNNTTLSLLLLDLDRFKEVNDTLGHAAGDLLLCSVADRLKNCLRDSDTVSRLGGDEFAILLPNISVSAIDHLTAKIIATLENVYHIEEHNLYVGMSIGIANFPEHGEDSSSLIQHADIAMYQSKRSNINISIYDPDKDVHNIQQLSLLADLKTALSNNEMFLHYQAISSLPSMDIVGFESLIRWQHPKFGLIPPDNFITIAEQTGIIKNLTRWVISQAIAQCAIWQSMGKDIYITVNLSVWDLQDPSLESYLKGVLSENKFPANKLVLEITESAMMSDAERAKKVLTRLNDMGLSIAIDDYGTGFSSLAYLKQLPVDTLKIDKSFVIDMDNDSNDETIVRSTIELAHNLGLNVIAEGVETNRIKDLLLKLNCDKIQGFLITKPVSVESATKLIATEKNNVSYLNINS